MSHSNEQVTAYLDIVNAEDALLSSLQHFLNIGGDESKVTKHISSSIAGRLAGNTPNPQSLSISAVPSTDPSSIEGRSTMSPRIYFSPIHEQTTAIQNKPSLLPAFEVQKKSKWIQSRGIR